MVEELEVCAAGCEPGQQVATELKATPAEEGAELPALAAVPLPALDSQPCRSCGAPADAAAAAAAAAAGDSADAAVAVAAATMPYQVLLQHVLRSASASAAEGPGASAGLDALLLSGAAGLSASLSASGTYEDGDAAAAAGGAELEVAEDGERSSDPGPASLRAAIRRLSSEAGYALQRNSDPGQPGAATTAAGVQQLLPLLQVVLTEGLATGQFELVNGQLQVKAAKGGAGSVPGSRGPSFSKGLAPAAPGSVGGASGSVGSAGGSSTGTPRADAPASDGVAAVVAIGGGGSGC